MSARNSRIIIGALAMVIAALVYLNVMEDNRKEWDVCYEMANAKISWQQTHYGGPWSD